MVRVMNKFHSRKTVLSIMVFIDKVPRTGLNTSFTLTKHSIMILSPKVKLMTRSKDGINSNDPLEGLTGVHYRKHDMIERAVSCFSCIMLNTNTQDQTYRTRRNFYFAIFAVTKNYNSILLSIILSLKCSEN